MVGWGKTPSLMFWTMYIIRRRILRTLEWMDVWLTIFFLSIIHTISNSLLCSKAYRTSSLAQREFHHAHRRNAIYRWAKRPEIDKWKIYANASSKIDTNVPWRLSHSFPSLEHHETFAPLKILNYWYLFKDGADWQDGSWLTYLISSRNSPKIL